jgi:hypothetical protein
MPLRVLGTQMHNDIIEHDPIQYGPYENHADNRMAISEDRWFHVAGFLRPLQEMKHGKNVPRRSARRKKRVRNR